MSAPDSDRLERIWCIVLSVGLVLAIFLATWGFAQSGSAISATSTVAHRVAQDEKRTCVIQSRGLPIGHQQALINAGLYSILTLKPSTRAERLAQRQEPARVRRLVHGLAVRLRRYQRLESTQPHGRSC